MTTRQQQWRTKEQNKMKLLMIQLLEKKKLFTLFKQKEWKVNNVLSIFFQIASAVREINDKKKLISWVCGGVGRPHICVVFAYLQRLPITSSSWRNTSSCRLFSAPLPYITDMD